MYTSGWAENGNRLCFCNLWGAFLSPCVFSGMPVLSAIGRKRVIHHNARKGGVNDFVLTAIFIPSDSNSEIQISTIFGHSTLI